MRVLRVFFSPPYFGKTNVFWGPSKNIFFRACRASVETRKTRIPAKGFAPGQRGQNWHSPEKVGDRKPGDHKPDDKPDDAPTQQAKAAPKLILSSEEFTRGFVPPGYLWDGILLRRCETCSRAGRIKVETYGRPSRPFQRLIAV